MTVVLFHRTTEDAAAKILAGGFRDAKGNYMTTKRWRGVWFSNVPLSCNEGAKGDVLLRVRFACHDARLWRWEWIEEDKPYREWLIPVRALERYIASIEVADEDEDL